MVGYLLRCRGRDTKFLAGEVIALVLKGLFGSVIGEFIREVGVLLQAS